MLVELKVVLAAAAFLAGHLQTNVGPSRGSVPLHEVHYAGLFDGAWRIENDWDETADQEYGAWVAALGAARERKVFRLARGLRDPSANPLYTPEDDALRFEVDCATLPYALRAYFAYKTGRPFFFMANKERRYRPGNRPRRLGDFTDYRDFPRLFRATLAAVSSGHFRIRSGMEGTDTYPIAVTRESIRPGVNYYDPAGHVLVVYRVDPLTGEIFLMDGHPDGTLTLKKFNRRIHRGSTRTGGGFRAWRRDHVVLLEARTGAFLHHRESNDEARFFSAWDQFRTTYEVDGVRLSYHEWVRWTISSGLVGPAPPSALDASWDRVQHLLSSAARTLLAM